MSKQYGLIIPNKNKAVPVKPTVLAKSSIFDEESDSDDEASKKPTGLKQALKKQDRVLQEKAMEEDPTIFQYDEVYDDIDEKRKQSKLARNDIDRKPKYISKLLEAAERRKRENERRIEREVQKERDAEGEEFKDKESFVTSAYRKKLEEMKEMEDKEKREEYLESIGDVRKQGNLDGFYRHLYDQKVNYGENSKDVKETVSKKESKIEEDPDLNQQLATPDSIKTSNKHQSPSPSHEKSNSSPNKPEKRSITETSEQAVPGRKKRKYRHRKQSGLDSSDEEKLEATTVETTKHIQSNLDADSDFSIDSSSDADEEKERDNKNSNSSIDILNKSTNVKSSEISDKNINTAEKDVIGNNEVKSSEKQESEKQVGKSEEVEKKPKIDIWKKRTIGVIFEEALQRYFQRKAIRESNQL